VTEVIIAVAKEVDQRRVVLSGGCFQNRYLIERMINNKDAKRQRGRNPLKIPLWCAVATGVLPERHACTTQ
jgi:hydrogenase maturation protein HypF